MPVRNVSFVASRRGCREVREMGVGLRGRVIRQGRSWRDLLGKRFLIGLARMAANDRKATSEASSSRTESSGWPCGVGDLYFTQRRKGAKKMISHKGTKRTGHAAGGAGRRRRPCKALRAAKHTACGGSTALFVSLCEMKNPDPSACHGSNGRKRLFPSPPLKRRGRLGPLSPQGRPLTLAAH